MMSLLGPNPIIGQGAFVFKREWKILEMINIQVNITDNHSAVHLNGLPSQVPQCCRHPEFEWSVHIKP